MRLFASVSAFFIVRVYLHANTICIYSDHPPNIGVGILPHTLNRTDGRMCREDCNWNILEY